MMAYRLRVGKGGAGKKRKNGGKIKNFFFSSNPQSGKKDSNHNERSTVS